MAAATVGTGDNPPLSQGRGQQCSSTPTHLPPQTECETLPRSCRPRPRPAGHTQGLRQQLTINIWSWTDALLTTEAKDAWLPTGRHHSKATPHWYRDPILGDATTQQLELNTIEHSPCLQKALNQGKNNKQDNEFKKMSNTSRSKHHKPRTPHWTQITHTAIWFWSGFENHSYHFLLCNLGSNIHNQGLPERRPWRWDETQKGPVHGLLRASLCCYNMLLDPTYRLP